MDNFTEQLYRFIKWQSRILDVVQVKYSFLAWLYDAEMCAVYDAINTLVRDGRITCDAVGCLGNGDYEVRLCLI